MSGIVSTKTRLENVAKNDRSVETGNKQWSHLGVTPPLTPPDRKVSSYTCNVNIKEMLI